LISRPTAISTTFGLFQAFFISLPFYGKNRGRVVPAPTGTADISRQAGAQGQAVFYSSANDGALLREKIVHGFVI
jgi:hypothetical protein